MPEAFARTNPMHGGKIDCHECHEWIYEDQEIKECFGVHFHEKCFNPYAHYYGLDKPID